MKVIGITGGIGSGKSTVLRILKEEFAGKILVADEIGHDLMRKGNQSYFLILDHFGKAMLDENGEIDRVQLGKLVFENEKELEALNSMIHPYVRAHIEDCIEEQKKKGILEYIFIETAILFEAGYEEICDEIWYIRSSESLRRKRLREERSYSEEKIENIMKNQLTDEDFCKRSTRIIVNDGNLNNLKEQLQLVLVS